MIEFISHSAAETEEFARKLGKKLKNGDIIAFKGGLGAGKTAFTRGIADGMKIDCEVTSPTFALVHEYRNGIIPLFHFDMYRVNDINDLYSTGFFDYLDENGVIAVEWSENIESVLPQNTIYITISAIDEFTRRITVDGGSLS